MTPDDANTKLLALKKRHAWAEKAIELDAQGWTLTPIARRFGVHKSTVYGVLVRARGKGKKTKRLKRAEQV